MASYRACQQRGSQQKTRTGTESRETDRVLTENERHADRSRYVLEHPLQLLPELLFGVLVNANGMFKPFQQHLSLGSTTAAFAETSQNALLASYVGSSSFDVLLRES